MKKPIKTIFTVIIVLAIGLGGAYYSGILPYPKEQETSIKAKPGEVVYQISGMDRIEVSKDIIYKVDKGRELQMDVYYPLEGKSKGGTIILIHGNTTSKNFKDIDFYASYGRLLGASGFTAITFNWRSQTNPEDISDLIRYVRQNSQELKFEGNKLGIVAFSGGVEKGIEAAVESDDSIAAIAANYGKLPMSILQSGKSVPPIFIADAALDTSFPKGTNDEFIKQAKAGGFDITHIVHSTGRHGFDVYDDNKQTHDIIKKMLNFLGDQTK